MTSMPVSSKECKRDEEGQGDADEVAKGNRDVRALMAKRNRASEKGESLHTSDSINHMQHVINMARAFGRSVVVPAVFTQTHKRADSDEFVDERSRRTVEEFTTRFSQVASEAASCSGASDPSQLDPAEAERLQTQVWVDVAGGKKKRQIYGTGSLARTIRRGTPSLTIREPASSSSQDTEEVQQLREANERTRQQMDALSTVMTAMLDVLPPERRDALQVVLQTSQPSTSIGPPPQQQDAGVSSQPQPDSRLTSVNSPR